MHHKEALKAAGKAEKSSANGVALRNIGVTYRDKGEFDEALKHFHQALDIHREIGFKQGEANALGNIGLIHRDRGEPEEALKYFQQAQIILEFIGDERLTNQIKSVISDLSFSTK